MLRVNNLNKAYLIREPSVKELVLRRKSQIPKVQALSDVSFEVDTACALGLVGSNGAGKSTLMKILSGILQPDSGFVEVNGEFPWENRIRYVSKIGYMAGQRSALFPELPPRDSFEYLRVIYNIHKDDFEERLLDLIGKLNFGEHMRKSIRSLSLGNRIKANLIGTLLHRPKILFLDEPTIGLDWKTRESLREFLKRYQSENETLLVISSHDFDDIEDVCDRFAIIESGKLQKFDRVSSIKKIGLRRFLKETDAGTKVPAQ